jgi:hypothetical protein
MFTIGQLELIGGVMKILVRGFEGAHVVKQLSEVECLFPTTNMLRMIGGNNRPHKPALWLARRFRLP